MLLHEVCWMYVCVCVCLCVCVVGEVLGQNFDFRILNYPNVPDFIIRNTFSIVKS